MPTILAVHTAIEFLISMLPCLNCSILCAVIDDYDYVFSENGLVAHKGGKLIGTQV